MWRHGDVLIDQCSEVPADARPLPHLILARGEATGHTHRILESGAVLYTGENGGYLRVTGDQVTLAHEEHGPIKLSRGTYRFWFQREYSPRGIRRVAD